MLENWSLTFLLLANLRRHCSDLSWEEYMYPGNSGKSSYAGRQVRGSPLQDYTEVGMPWPLW